MLSFHQDELCLVLPLLFFSLPKTVNESWNALAAPSDKLYCWNPKSTYIKSPPFFEDLVGLFLFFLNKMSSSKSFLACKIYLINQYPHFDYLLHWNLYKPEQITLRRAWGSWVIWLEWACGLSVQGFHMAVQRPLEIKYHGDRDSVTSEGDCPGEQPLGPAVLKPYTHTNKGNLLWNWWSGVCALPVGGGDERMWVEGRTPAVPSIWDLLWMWRKTAICRSIPFVFEGIVPILHLLQGWDMDVLHKFTLPY